jgi:hypothetical protein
MAVYFLLPTGKIFGVAVDFNLKSDISINNSYYNHIIIIIIEISFICNKLVLIIKKNRQRFPTSYKYELIGRFKLSFE